MALLSDFVHVQTQHSYKEDPVKALFLYNYRYVGFCMAISLLFYSMKDYVYPFVILVNITSSSGVCWDCPLRINVHKST